MNGPPEHRLDPQPLFLRIAISQHKKDRGSYGTILLLRGEIQSALSVGRSRSQIWKTLTADQRVSMKYRTFLRYLRRARIGSPQPQESATSAQPCEHHAKPQFPLQ